MRLLEQHNPGIAFDWDRLLAGGPGTVPAGTGDERRRERRERRRAGAVVDRAGSPRTEGGSAVEDGEDAAMPDAGAADPQGGDRLDDVDDQFADPSAFALEDRRDDVDLDGMPADDRPDSPEPASVPRAPTPEVPEALPPVVPEPVEPHYARLGADGLRRLRARHADVRARLEARPADEAERAELEARVERLNPDAWHNEEEVAHALEEYETVFESLRPLVGRQPKPPRL
jgi:hypothetical protein